jgi:hypothetical protein
MSQDIVEKAKQVQSAHQNMTRSIYAYQNTLVAWIDEEGREQIGTYTEFLLDRA